MKYEPVEGVQPAILRWARASVGLSVIDVADMIKRKPEDIESWESGETAPTYPQLEKLAYQIYKRPLAVFFLPSPPEETLPQREFRTLPDADMNSLARDTYLHIRRAHAYQLALKELFDGQNPTGRYIWKSLTLSPSASLTVQAEAIRGFLGITLETQKKWKSDEQALGEWRKAVEDSGIFVFKSPFKQEDISGFCLKDETFPVIYLNNSTTKTRQIFSLLHELAHLLFSVNGLSKFGTGHFDQLPATEKKIEQFCNAIAAEVLIPSDDFTTQTKKLPAWVEEVSDDVFSDLARRYGVSREAILRRFLDDDRVSTAFYESKARYWVSQMKKSGGGDYYRNQGAYLSDRFAREVVSRHYRHQITLEHAADLLGLKPKTFAEFEERFLQGANA